MRSRTYGPCSPVSRGWIIVCLINCELRSPRRRSHRDGGTSCVLTGDRLFSCSWAVGQCSLWAGVGLQPPSTARGWGSAVTHPAAVTNTRIDIPVRYCSWGIGGRLIQGHRAGGLGNPAGGDWKGEKCHVAGIREGENCFFRLHALHTVAIWGLFSKAEAATLASVLDQGLFQERELDSSFFSNLFLTSVFPDQERQRSKEPRFVVYLHTLFLLHCPELQSFNSCSLR